MAFVSIARFTYCLRKCAAGTTKKLAVPVATACRVDASYGTRTSRRLSGKPVQAGNRVLVSHTLDPFLYQHPLHRAAPGSQTEAFFWGTPLIHPGTA